MLWDRTSDFDSRSNKLQNQNSAADAYGHGQLNSSTAEISYDLMLKLWRRRSRSVEYQAGFVIASVRNLL